MMLHKTVINPGGIGPEIKTLIVEASMTDDEIELFIDEAEDNLGEARKGFYLTVSGFDDDRRELWQIPEAISLCDRLVAKGMLSLLEFNTPFDPEYKPSMIGAIQLWAWNKGLGGQFLFDRPLFDRFIEDIKVSNAVIDNRKRG